MPQLNSITSEKLARLIGTPAAPRVVDLRSADVSDDQSIPAGIRRTASGVAQWAPELAATPAVIVCEKGDEASKGIAAWLRQEGRTAEYLEGGYAAWRAAGLPLVPTHALPERDATGRTVWVTRSRPKVDRIACPWLIRRFVDPDARVLFVAAEDVLPVAQAFGGAPFDISAEGVVWSHDGERCTFDVMVERLGLSGFPALLRLAEIVRGADTDRLDIAPQAAGLLAVSLGLSRMYADDIAQLDAGMLIYDALYRWCRDAVGETHDWVSHAPKAKGRHPAKAEA